MKKELFTNEELCEILSFTKFENIKNVENYKIEEELEVVYINDKKISFSINDLLSFCRNYIIEVFTYEYTLSIENDEYVFTVYDIEDEGGFGFFDKTLIEKTEYDVIVKMLKFLLN